VSSYSKRGAAAVLTVACFAIAGCGSGSGSSPENAGATVGSQDSAANPASGVMRPPTEGASASAIDACSLLSTEDISALLGVPVKGTSTGTDPELAGCLWENPANYESVSLEIGSPNTAANGTLPPPEPGFPEVGTPGPEGMRFLGSGSVEFAAGGRSNLVQVAVLSMLGDDADAAAVELARKVGWQLPD